MNEQLGIVASEGKEKTNFLIPAEAHSDDHVIEINFDAVDFMRVADTEELQALINYDWGGNYPGDYVAFHYEDGVLKPLFDYVHAKKDECGLECYVDGKHALDWLKKNRPEVMEELTIPDEEESKAISEIQIASQEIYIVLSQEELVEETLTIHSGVWEGHSTDFIGAAQSLEGARDLMRRKKNFINQESGWSFVLLKYTFESGKTETVEDNIEPWSL